MSNLSLPSSVELISVHVHKTAGSTFGYKILPQIYRQEKILYDNENLSLETLVERGKLTNDTRVIHGHLAARKYQDYLPRAELVIWLRNPLILLISLYFFWYELAKSGYRNEQHRYVVENKLSFSDFIELKNTQNHVSLYYTRGLNLTDFHFIGIQEFFTEDLSDFMQKLGKQVEETIYNKNSYPGYNSKTQEILEDKKLIRRIVELNNKDLQLYHLALKIRAKRKGLSNSLQMYEQNLEFSRALMEKFHPKDLN